MVEALTCDTGYSLDNGVCVECSDPGVLTCTASAALTCADNYSLVDGVCVQCLS